MVERQKALGVQEMPSEGASLAERRERRQARRARACLRQGSGDDKEPDSSGEFPGHGKGARNGTGTAGGGKASAGPRDTRDTPPRGGPHAPGWAGP